jgi:hypothetical protein
MGRPKKVKRAYHRKVVQQPDEQVVLTKEISIEDKMPSIMPGDLAKALAEPLKKAVPLKKQNETFFNLEQGRIELEAAEQAQKEAEKKRQAELIEKAQKDNAHQPKLVCPFCSHVQYKINSKDVTAAWCEVCGRCFQALWQ